MAQFNLMTIQFLDAGHNRRRVVKEDILDARKAAAAFLDACADETLEVVTLSADSEAFPMTEFLVFDRETLVDPLAKNED